MHSLKTFHGIHSNALRQSATSEGQTRELGRKDGRFSCRSSRRRVGLSRSLSLSLSLSLRIVVIILDVRLRARFREEIFFQGKHRRGITKRRNGVKVTFPDAGCSGGTSISLSARIVIVLYPFACLVAHLERERERERIYATDESKRLRIAVTMAIQPRV